MATTYDLWLKNSYKFLNIAALLLIAGFIFYYINNPKYGMIVRQDGKWTVIERNVTHKDKK